jgi:hypothetical protein
MMLVAITKGQHSNYGLGEMQPESLRMSEELQRLNDDEYRQRNWKRWGPYLSERQWATVREDYSERGDISDYFPHAHPPVHAWAAWRVYKISGGHGSRDTDFLESVFHKLLLNFTWWVNRKDTEGNNIFSGGFLGLDNIGVFDRSRPLPTGGYLQQADGTAWMGFYCLTMLSIALELAQTRPAYEDMASKFFEHFVAICDSVNTLGGNGLWDEEDGFYYDQLKIDGKMIPLKTRSLVGLLPMVAAEILDEDTILGLKGFRRRMEWFLHYRPDLSRLITIDTKSCRMHRLLAVFGFQ